MHIHIYTLSAYRQDALCKSWSYDTSWTLIELIPQALCYCFCQCSCCQTRRNCNHISMKCWRIWQVWQSPDSHVSLHPTCLHTAPSWLPVIWDSHHCFSGLWGIGIHLVQNICTPEDLAVRFMIDQHPKSRHIESLEFWDILKSQFAHIKPLMGKNSICCLSCYPCLGVNS